MLHSEPVKVQVVEPNFSEQVKNRFPDTIPGVMNRQLPSQWRGGNECQAMPCGPLEMAPIGVELKVAQVRKQSKKGHNLATRPDYICQGERSERWRKLPKILLNPWDETGDV